MGLGHFAPILPSPHIGSDDSFQFPELPTSLLCLCVLSTGPFSVLVIIPVGHTQCPGYTPSCRSLSLSHPEVASTERQRCGEAGDAPLSRPAPHGTAGQPRLSPHVSELRCDSRVLGLAADFEGGMETLRPVGLVWWHREGLARLPRPRDGGPPLLLRVGRPACPPAGPVCPA